MRLSLPCVYPSCRFFKKCIGGADTAAAYDGLFVTWQQAVAMSGHTKVELLKVCSTAASQYCISNAPGQLQTGSKAVLSRCQPHSGGGTTCNVVLPVILYCLLPGALDMQRPSQQRRIFDLMNATITCPPPGVMSMLGGKMYRNKSFMDGHKYVCNLASVQAPCLVISLGR